MSVIVQIKVLGNGVGLKLPEYATDGSSGVDLLAAIQDDIILLPSDRVLVPVGISIALPQNYEAQIRPRSGLALKNGISVLNTPGTIDSDYRGEIMVILINLGKETFVISRGMRIAQMVFASVEKCKFHVLKELSETVRNDGGFGSTGK